MENLIITILLTSIPILLAGTGELIAEKSGVLNLGVEGMMLTGAVTALGSVLIIGNPYAGIFFGAIAGILISLIFSFFTISLMTNQVATGLGLTIFATGLTGLIGEPFVGKTITSLPKIEILFLSDLPIVGSIFFKQDILFYFSIFLIIAVHFFLIKSRYGIIVRSVGDNHESAHSIGYPVKKIRWLCVGFGGMCAGMGGAYIPLALTPHWSEGMTAGKGWIALALVVFASWLPFRLLLGALIFGGITILQFVGQARGWPLPSQFLNMLPYLVTILALSLISLNTRSGNTLVPSSLGKPFFENN